jgi:predicted small lipoprotein YifL
MKKAVILFFALVLLVFISGCKVKGTDLGFELPEEEAPPEDNGTENGSDENDSDDLPSDPARIVQTTLSDCLAMSTTQKRNCITALAIEKKDASICDNLDLLKDECIRDVAIESDNVSLCNRITSETVKKQCKDTIAAQGTGRLNCFAYNETQNKDECFLKEAIATKNHLLCKEISGSKKSGNYVRDECYTSILRTNKTLSICPLFINKELSQKCYYAVSIHLKNPTGCNEIKETQKKNECKKIIAVANANSSTCEEITNKKLMNECLLETAVSSENMSTCEKIKDLTMKAECIKEVADKIQDLETCKKINITAEREKCFLKTAIAKNDSKICEKISASILLKDECHHYFAGKNSDISLCEKINSETKYYACVLNAAILNESPETCFEVKRKNLPNYTKYPTKDLCLKDSSIALSLPSLCEEIINADLKKACIEEDETFH